MTDDKLKLLAELRGVTVEELREQYSQMGKKSPRTGGITSSERAKELQRLSTIAKRKKKDVKD